MKTMTSTSILGAATTTLIIALSCFNCLAAPSNRSSTAYECLTDDVCKTGNFSGYSVLQKKVYCCLNGDAISISVRGKQEFHFFSSHSGLPNTLEDASKDTSAETSEESSKDASLEQRDDDDDKNQFSNVEVNCTCGQVDYEKLRNEILSQELVFEGLKKSLKDWLLTLGPRSWWWW